MRISPTLIALLFAAAAAQGGAAAPLFSIGTGDLNGGYYAAAGAICDQLNRDQGKALRCSPESTPGSLYNLSSLEDRQLDFALVQSDWEQQASQGSGPFAATGPMNDMRTVMSLYPETVTLLVRRGAPVASVRDLVGKRVDIGLPASGRHATALRLLDLFSLKPEDFASLPELPASSAISELCAGRLDATIQVIGHPNDAIGQALADCDAVLVPIETAAEGLGYVGAFIPAAAYPNHLAADVPTLAVTATLLTRADMDPAVVQTLTAETLDNLGVLAARAPILAGLDPKAMGLALAAPMHPGAHAAFNQFLHTP